MRVLTEIVGGVMLLLIFAYGVRYLVNEFLAMQEKTDEQNRVHGPVPTPESEPTKRD